MRGLRYSYSTKPNYLWCLAAQPNLYLKHIRSQDSNGFPEENKEAAALKYWKIFKIDLKKQYKNEILVNCKSSW